MENQLRRIGLGFGFCSAYVLFSVVSYLLLAGSVSLGYWFLGTAVLVALAGGVKKWLG